MATLKFSVLRICTKLKQPGRTHVEGRLRSGLEILPKHQRHLPPNIKKIMTLYFKWEKWTFLPNKTIARTWSLPVRGVRSLQSEKTKKEFAVLSFFLFFFEFRKKGNTALPSGRMKIEYFIGQGVVRLVHELGCTVRLCSIARNAESLLFTSSS